MPLPLLDSASASITNVPPPLGFRAVDTLRDVWRSDGSGITALSAKRSEGSPRQTHSLSQKAGLRYERKALSALEDAFADAVELKPWFQFRDALSTRFCQPDAIARIDGAVVVFEIKLMHTANAWWQLRKLYQPVVEFVVRAPALVCEITSSYDPAAPFPEDIELLQSADAVARWARDPLAPFGVWQWKL